MFQNISITLCIILIIFIVPFYMFADDNTIGGTDKVMITLDDFKPLIGHWEGEGFGGICEEIWSPASGNSMVGTFKLINDGKTSFYEIMTLREDSAGFSLKVKHFNPDLTGWEEKNDMTVFPFEGIEKDKIVFGGLIYHFKSESKMDILVSVKHKDGTKGTEIISCRTK